MDPRNEAASLALFENLHATTLASFTNDLIIAGLTAAGGLVTENRIFDAMRTIRALFATEEAIIERNKAAETITDEVRRRDQGGLGERPCPPYRPSARWITTRS